MSEARHAAALPFGAALVDPAHTRFRVWAPSCRHAEVVFDGSGSAALEREVDGWFSATLPCAAGTAYRYRFDGGAPVPDPAARAQRGGPSGPSLVVDPLAYTWRRADWRGRPWREAVVYELHAGLWGGFDGVRAQLPRLRDLGITAIELMPIAEFPGRRNWGYDGVLPFAPAGVYGGVDALKALVDAAHDAGLMILLDVVYNHFGPEGNHLPAYAAPFFRDAQPTPWGPALDFGRAEVRAFFTANARYWIEEYRFDGLRLDAVHAIAPRDWLAELAAEVRAAAPDRHVHLIVENEANESDLLERGFDAQWNDDFHHAVHVLLTGEHEGYYADYAPAPARDLARCLSEGFARQGDLPSPQREAPRGQPSAHLPPTRFVAFLQNHDQVGNRAFGERLAVLTAPQTLRAAIALLLLTPQIPLLWMGEEWGATGPFLYFADYRSPLAEAVRDGRRREFAGFAAFGDPAVREAIPDPNAAATFAASMPDLAAVAGGSETTRYYRRLLEIRRRELVPYLDEARALGAAVLAPAAVVARWRLAADRVLALWVNFGETTTVAPGTGRVLFECRPGVAAALAGGTLPARSLIACMQDEERR